MSQCGIYKITNIYTNKIYIGQAININRRWTEHKNRAFDPNSSSYNTPLDRSIRKYGKEAFTMEIIEECKASLLDTKEIEYIQKYNCITPNGYNVLPGENSPPKKVKYCIECGAVMSNDTKGNLCHLCYPKTVRKVERPSADELLQLLKDNNGNFSKIGRMFGVCDNSIRKWCSSYNLPTHSKDYK